MSKLCTIHECETVLTLENILALNEIVLVQNENQRRAYDMAEAKARK